MLNRYVSFSDDVLADGSWYQEDDEDEREIDNLFMSGRKISKTGKAER